MATISSAFAGVMPSHGPGPHNNPTGTREFSGVARWADLASTLHVDRSDVDVDRTSVDGRRLIMVGEFHNATRATFDDLLTLSAETAPRLLGELAGGFAGAVVDPKTQTILLVTDPFGVRPIYYWSDRQGIAFATRLRDLERAGGMSLTVDRQAIYHYLNF